MKPVIRRILVTGAYGFVGRHLQNALRQAFPEAILSTDWFDVGNEIETRQAVRGVGPDACVHLAGITAIPTAQRDPDRAWRINLNGTLNLARAVLAEAPACRFLHVSTAEAYGQSFKIGLPLNESAPLAPMNDYSATKSAADLAVGALVFAGLRAVRFRPFNHTGPGQVDSFVVPAFARQIAEIVAGVRPPLMRVGALDPSRDFLDVRDVCAAYVACLSCNDDTLPPGTILNLASGTARRIGDVLRDMCDIAGVAVTIETDETRLRPVEIPVACGDATRARDLLGWAPLIPWDQTLRDVINDWRHRVAAEAAS
jgi:GDP-4-dehydro-6-deoxy-D-mannose reductase